MNYTSKYDIGHHVFVVSSDTFNRIVKCLTCQGAGKVSIGAEEFVCPKCSGRAAHPQHAGRKYYVAHEGIIGKIEISHMPNDGYFHQPEPQVTYMIDSTGVGSGNVWKESELFSTRAYADAYCDSRNAILPKDEARMLESGGGYGAAGTNAA